MWHAIAAYILIISVALAAANVEKTIFQAPEAIEIPQSQLSLEQLQLETLTPTTSVLRRQLRAAFPTLDEPEGPSSWFLLDSLNPYQRHEVRVCWLATVNFPPYPLPPPETVNLYVLAVTNTFFV